MMLLLLRLLIWKHSGWRGTQRWQIRGALSVQLGGAQALGVQEVEVETRACSQPTVLLQLGLVRGVECRQRGQV